MGIQLDYVLTFVTPHFYFFCWFLVMILLILHYIRLLNEGFLPLITIGF